MRYQEFDLTEDDLKLKIVYFRLQISNRSHASGDHFMLLPKWLWHLATQMLILKNH